MGPKTWGKEAERGERGDTHKQSLYVCIEMSQEEMGKEGG